ncbi:MAG: hypothetical protein LBH86_00845 [Oscillospiraceae bacterium]|nr:hypothetical protein [Oscillospiraceae bacterium]
MTSGKNYRKTVGILSADARARKLYEKREKAHRDLSSRAGGVKQKQSVEMALELIKRNRPIEEIIEGTGLSREDIEHIQELA